MLGTVAPRTHLLLPSNRIAISLECPSAGDGKRPVCPRFPQQATEIVESPASQKLVDNLNNGNINVIQDVGGKLVRITLDPSGQRIISAGYVQARNVANSIASGRFTPQ